MTTGTGKSPVAPPLVSSGRFLDMGVTKETILFYSRFGSSCTASTSRKLFWRSGLSDKAGDTSKCDSMKVLATRPKWATHSVTNPRYLCYCLAIRTIYLFLLPPPLPSSNCYYRLPDSYYSYLGLRTTEHPHILIKCLRSSPERRSGTPWHGINSVNCVQKISFDILC